MSSEQPKREQARDSLRELVGVLQSRDERGGSSAEHMILSCRRILDLWNEAGGASTDHAVIGFLAIETQTDHVLGGRSARSGRDGDRRRFVPGSAQEAAEVEDCGRWFLDDFRRGLAGLREFLSDPAPGPSRGSNKPEGG